MSNLYASESHYNNKLLNLQEIITDISISVIASLRSVAIISNALEFATIVDEAINDYTPAPTDNNRTMNEHDWLVSVQEVYWMISRMAPDDSYFPVKVTSSAFTDVGIHILMETNVCF